MLPSADKLYGDADSTHPAEVGTCTHCQKYHYFHDLGMTVLNKPENLPETHRDSNWYCQEEDQRYKIQQWI